MVGSDLWWELTYATADLFAKKMKKISASQGESAKESHFSAGEGKNRRHFFFPETAIFFSLSLVIVVLIPPREEKEKREEGPGAPPFFPSPPPEEPLFPSGLGCRPWRGGGPMLFPNFSELC